MKTFFSSFIIFSLMIFSIVLNSRYLSSVSKQLFSLAEALPAFEEEDADGYKRDESLMELKEYWEKHREAASFTVQMRVIEGIDDALGAMSAAIRYSDPEEFERAREHFLRITEDLGYYDRVTIGSLF